MLTLLFEEKCILTWRGEIGVCGIVVLNNFSYVILVILLSKCGIAFFHEPAAF